MTIGTTTIGTTTIGNGYELLDARPLLPDRTEAGHAFRWRPARWIQQLVIHHDAGAAVDSAATESFELERLMAIYRYHRGPRPGDGTWAGIGYHFAVFPSGRAWYVGDLETSRAHVAQRNPWTVGIVLIGTFNRDAPHPEQLGAARRLVAEVQFQLGWFVPVAGHREAALQGHGTACPGETWPQWKRAVTVTADGG